jgi:flavin reductase ActVB
MLVTWEGCMPLDPDTFRAALGRFPSGVCVVTTRDASRQPRGFTASAFSSLSLTPPLILVCLDQRAESHDAFRDSGAFAVSILASSQTALAGQFAVRTSDKFSGVDVIAGAETGLPLIPAAVAHLECNMHQTIPVGDHTILVGEVIGAAVFDGEPLVYHNRRYGRFYHHEE